MTEKRTIAERALGAVPVAIAAAAAIVGNVQAASGRGLHKKIYAVPAPGKVLIDGSLGDWDLSGQLFMYVMQETSEMQSARFALMYDADALYLGAIVRDPSPMTNRNDPRVNGDKGWDADACQFRTILDASQGYPVDQSTFNAVDNDQMVHLTLWYYTDRREPCLQMHCGMTYKVPRPGWAPFGVVPHDMFQAAYVPAADGRGYTFEYRIPWSTLGARKPPRAGDLVAGTVQFNWGTPDGLKTAGGAAWCYDVMSGPGFPFQSSACWGKVVFSERGGLPRELVDGDLPPEPPLPLTFAYHVPEDSQVTVQLFDRRNLVVRTLVAQGDRRAGPAVERWDGLDDAGQLLPAGTYTWKGLYHRPITTKFLFAAHNSGAPPYSTDDDKGGWGGDHGTPTAACALPDGMLLAWNACELGWGIIKTDLDGRKQWGSKHCARFLAADGARFFGAGDEGFEKHSGVKVYDAGDSRPLNFGSGRPIADLPPGGDEVSNAVTGLACANGVLYVALGARGLVALNDAAQGTLKGTWKIEAPGAMAAARDGSVLVASGGKVLRVRDGKVRDFISTHLDAPSGIAIGPDGRIYVANRGALQNVSIFDAEGRYLRSIGKTGGRPRVGRYEKDGMLEPGGIAIDARGRLWVAETLDSPKRYSVWNAADGSLADEFFGASAYFGWIWMDPKRPDEVYCHNTIWKVDWAKNSCYPASTIWRATGPNVIGEVNPNGYAGHLRVMTAKNGRQYAWGQGFDYGGRLLMREGDIFKPIAAAINVAKGSPWIAWPPYPIFADEKKFPDGTYLWQDSNDDQTIQESELVSLSGRSEAVFNWLDAELQIWNDNGTIFRPVRVETDGRPVYDFARAEPVPFRGWNSNATSLWLDDRDDTVYTLNPGQRPGLARWTRQGSVLWGYPSILPWNEALNLPMVTPGKLHGLTMPLGVAGDFIGAAAYFNPYHVFTRDGLYVAMLMRDGRDGKGLGPDVIATESIQGQLVKPEGMDRYFLLAGAHEGRVMEVLGLDTVKRLPGGTYVHTDEDVKRAAEALAEYRRALARSQKLEIVRGRGGLEGARAVGRTVDAERAFAVRAAYDEKNLYVLYDVTSPSPLVNGYPETKLVFKGGNLLDIQIATDPAADARRTTPAPGDLRLLVTRQRDEPLAVIYRPKVKGFAGEPTVLSSPTGKESFDVIEVSPRVGLEYRPRAGGFEALVTVPLDVLGWRPKAGATVRLDFGYVFGNASGTQTALRAYWRNNGRDANVLNDVPSESRLSPAEWGTATVE